MKPGRLVEIGQRLYGERGWQARMAETLKVDGSTVRRWVSGAVPISGPVQVALECLFKTWASR